MTGHLSKLAKTLVNSGLASDSEDALKKAKEILRIKDVEPDKSTLPKIEDIQAAGKTPEASGDGSLKEIVEEDAKTIYGKRPGRQN